MPILETRMKTPVSSRLGINKVPECQRWVVGWQQRERVFSSLEGLVSCDRLTQLANRDGFEAYLEQQWQHMGWEQASLSLILCDLDILNNDDDRDRVQQVAQAIATTMNHSADRVAHYGDQKFAVVLPNTDAENAIGIAEDIRARVKALKIAQTNSQPSQDLTLSLGVASMVPSHEYSSTMLLTAAAQALYQAKVQGGNRVILYEKWLRQTPLAGVGNFTLEN